MPKSLKLERLEKKFNVATKLIEDLDDISIEFEENIKTDISIPSVGEIAIQEEIFTVNQLKQDFLMIRQNIMSLITKGQRILDQVSILELSELKPSQIDAMSNLQAVIGGNLKLLISVYKEVSEIEKLRQKQLPVNETGNINMGTVNTNNIVFTGSPNDLLDFIASQKKE
jgi:hypothetical protein